MIRMPWSGSLVQPIVLGWSKVKNRRTTFHPNNINASSMIGVT
jgi:hypothetical protein